MPGLSFICNFRNDLQSTESAFIRALDALLHRENYERKVLLRNKSSLLGWTAYRQYPVHLFETNNFSIILEGKIYGKNQATMEKQLSDIAETVFASQVHKQHLVKWHIKTDGEFILFLLNKQTNTICILNDALAHLPLYYSISHDQILVSREIRFIANLLDKAKFDKMSLAQYLIFRYSLEERTLWKNIFRLKPMSCIRIDPNHQYVNVENLHTLNFDDELNRETLLEQNVQRLLTLHNEACKNRDQSANGLKNVLSLSGGLDSRFVCASLKRCEIPFTSATFLDFRKTAASDVSCAREVAECLGIEWKLFELSPPKGKDTLALLRTKNGMNYLEMAFIIPFLTQLQEYYGPNINYFTGDTGLNVRGYLLPGWVRNLDDLLDYILSNNARFALEDAAKLLNLAPQDIRQEIKSCLESFPESQLQGKYLHFIIYGRCFVWHYEGMDRNRFFFWLAAPMEATPFFVEAMNCPQNQKKNHRLYRTLLQELLPDVAVIRDASTKAAITSTRYRASQFMTQSLVHFLSRYPRLVLKLKKKLAKKFPYKQSSATIKCIREQTRNCPSLYDYFAPSAIEKIINHCDQHSQGNIDILFTLTSTIEDFICHSSSIENYLDSALYENAE